MFADNLVQLPESIFQDQLDGGFKVVENQRYITVSYVNPKINSKKFRCFFPAFYDFNEDLHLLLFRNIINGTKFQGLFRPYTTSFEK